MYTEVAGEEFAAEGWIRVEPRGGESGQKGRGGAGGAAGGGRGVPHAAGE